MSSDDKITEKNIIADEENNVSLKKSLIRKDRIVSNAKLKNNMQLSCQMCS